MFPTAATNEHSPESLRPLNHRPRNSGFRFVRGVAITCSITPAGVCIRPPRTVIPAGVIILRTPNPFEAHDGSHGVQFGIACDERRFLLDGQLHGKGVGIGDGVSGFDSRRRQNVFRLRHDIPDRKRKHLLFEGFGRGRPLSFREQVHHPPALIMLIVRRAAPVDARSSRRPTAFAAFCSKIHSRSA